MLNVAVLMGRLVATPELRHTANDTAVCSFRVAVERNFSGRSGERQTDFIDVVAWRQTAEFVCRYFTKGQMIAVDGSIQTRSYEDRQGNKRTAVEVVANNINFCGSKRESEGGSGGSYGSDGYGGGGYGYNNNTRNADPAPDNFPDDNGGLTQAPAFSNGDDSGFESIFNDDDLPF